MTQIDPEQERVRLRDVYARLSDGELVELANQEAELTDLARELLNGELRRREIKEESFGSPESSAEIPINYEGESWVTIRRFRDLPSALLAKGSLESAGIHCFLRDENIVRLDWLWSNLMGGIRMQVAPEDVESAIEILDQPIAESLEVEGIGAVPQPQCPKCQSLDIGFQEPTWLAYVSTYLFVPIPDFHSGWRCHACHAEWNDTSE